MTATRGLRATDTCAMPQAASMPISREPITVPARNSILAARDVGAGIGYELPGRGGAADLDRARAGGLGVLDHDDGVGTARHRPAGRNRGGGARQHRPCRRDAAGDHFVVQHQANRRRFSGRGKIGGAHRKTVDIGAVERRHVDRRHDILRQRAAERVGEPPLFGGNGAREQRRLEARQRVFARQDGQELVLLGGFAVFRLLCAWSCRKLLSFPQHIAIDRRARSKTFGAA